MSIHTHTTNWMAGAAALLIAAIAGPATAGILIGPDTENGSFETGVNWWRSINTTLTTSTVTPPGPTHGEDYLVVDFDSGNGGNLSNKRVDLWNMNPPEADGKQFTLSFDAAKAETNGADTVVAFLLFDNSNRMTIVSSLATSYQRVSDTVEVPIAEWDDIDLRIEFRKSNAAPDTTYTAYLDNVVLEQVVPEPASLGLLAIGGATALVRRRKA